MGPFLDASFLAEEGAGVFESLRAYEGVLFRVEEHLTRFFESAHSLGVKIPETRPEIRRKLEKASEESGQKEAFLRLTLLGGEVFVIVTERIHPSEIYKKGVSLKTSPVRRNPSQAGFPEAKSTAFLNQILGTLDPAPPGNYEILFLDAEGYVTEVRIGNIFAVTGRDGSRTVPFVPGRTVPVLLTPPPRGLLNGVTRRFVLECALRAGIPAEERPLTRHELFNADEAFLTNTSWEILPVREADGRRIGDEVPGPVTRKLQKLFREGVRREIRKQK